MTETEKYDLEHELKHKYEHVACVDSLVLDLPGPPIEVRNAPQRSSWSRCDHSDSSWTETGYVLSISMSQFLDEYLASGFFALIPTLIHDLDMSSTSVTWSAGVTSLVVSALLLTFGRLVDMWGGLPIFLGGIAWTFVWTLLIGWATDARTLIFCRAMQGLGAAAHLPAGLAMLGKMYKSGQRKNILFSIYGAMAPLGSFVGIFVASLALHHGHWSIFFWSGAVLAFLVLTSIFLTKPPGDRERGDSSVRMDWTGSISLSASLSLLVFTLTQAADAAQRWKTPYIIWTGVSAIFGLLVTIRVEGWVATQPLLPPSLFQIQGIVPLLSGLLLSYGAVTLFVCYATL
jgi:MFS family permease